MSKSTLAKQPETLEIESGQWIPFLARFTRDYRGAHARLDILGKDAEVAYRVETEDRPFEGISADMRNHEHSVWISFGSKPGNHLTHGVHDAKAIRLLPRIGSAGPVLEVESADGTNTVLELTNPEAYALPPGK